MAVAADVPCAGCGKTIRLGGQSKPPGEAKCRPCFLKDEARSHVHSASGYSRGCRCDVCKSAANARNRVTYHKTRARPAPGRPCTICGVVFSGRNHRATTCSAECARQRNAVSTWNYQTRKREAFVEPVIPAEIFKRDGWRCHICRRKLSAKTKWPHPRTPSIDHLIPLTRGGLHERANVKTACLSCNSAKGNRGGNEQLLLIG